MVVHTDPEGAKIIVDGKATKYHSPVNFDLPAGKHTIGIERNGFAIENREVMVLKNQTTQLDAALTPNGKKRNRLFPFR